MESDKRLILIIDDTPLILSVLSDMLMNEYKIIFAKNGETGLRLAAQRMPDLILLDVVMPEMNGFDVLAAIKADEAIRDIPVIMITGSDSAESEDRGYALGAADYVRKPFSEGAVRYRIRANLELMDLRRMAQQA